MARALVVLPPAVDRDDPLHEPTGSTSSSDDDVPLALTHLRRADRDRAIAATSPRRSARGEGSWPLVRMTVVSVLTGLSELPPPPLPPSDGVTPRTRQVRGLFCFEKMILGTLVGPCVAKLGGALAWGCDVNTCGVLQAVAGVAPVVTLVTPTIAAAGDAIVAVRTPREEYDLRHENDEF